MQRKRDVIAQLKKDILQLQGVSPDLNPTTDSMGLGPVEAAFPNGIFPRKSIHEFVIANGEQGAATYGFISGILSRLMGKSGVCIWISTSNTHFPPAAQSFGVSPHRIIFVRMARDRDVRWATEEALKCKEVVVVVAELQEMDFVQSRRLQLAVEKSKVTGLVICPTPRQLGATACTARWQIKPLPSIVENGLPGIGQPQWEVTLLKVRHGNPGSWSLSWSDMDFVMKSAPTHTKQWSNKPLTNVS